MKLLFVLICFAFAVNSALSCAITTASGSQAPKTFCHGDLIFEDHFDHFNFGKWKHDITMSGGGNNEFQWYVNDRANTWTENGKLHIRPTFTSDYFGEDFLYWGRIVIPPSECTSDFNNGCDRTGNSQIILPPMRSGKVTTWDSFSFKYGILEIRAKMPAGDWLWPALWMMPKGINNLIKFVIIILIFPSIKCVFRLSLWRVAHFRFVSLIHNICQLYICILYFGY